MHTWLDGHATSHRGIGAELGGSVFAASLVGGYSFALGSGWTSRRVVSRAATDTAAKSA
jgi:hypothetical protein